MQYATRHINHNLTDESIIVYMWHYAAGLLHMKCIIYMSLLINFAVVLRGMHTILHTVCVSICLSVYLSLCAHHCNPVHDLFLVCNLIDFVQIEAIRTPQ